MSDRDIRWLITGMSIATTTLLVAFRLYLAMQAA
jgi:hypothetical protein